MYKPVVNVFVPKEHIDKFPNEKQTENEMFDYVYKATNKDYVFCRTKAKSLWYYQSVIFEDMISECSNIINPIKVIGNCSSLTNNENTKKSLKMRIMEKKEKVISWHNFINEFA